MVRAEQKHKARPVAIDTFQNNNKIKTLAIIILSATLRVLTRARSDFRVCVGPHAAADRIIIIITHVSTTNIIIIIILSPPPRTPVHG